MKKQHKKHEEGMTVLSWVAPEYIAHPKSRRWYAVAAAVVAVTVAYAIYTGNWTMAAAVVVFTAVYQYTHHYHPPKNIKITVTDMGIRVGHLFFPYSHIKLFWIIYKPDYKTLNLRISGNFWSDLTIALNDQNPVALRSYLIGEIPEWEGKDERLGDLILRLLRL